MIAPRPLGGDWARAPGRWPRPSPPAWIAAAATLLATAPLFRGELLLGHDALEYPTRLAELHEVVRHGILLPVWAPDLGAGFGQPMFGFVPPCCS